MCYKLRNKGFFLCNTVPCQNNDKICLKEGLNITFCATNLLAVENCKLTRPSIYNLLFVYRIMLLLCRKNIMKHIDLKMRSLNHAK